jgi:iron complex outermembrane receptor protein
MYKDYPAEVMVSDPVTGERDLGGLTQGDMLMYGVDLQADMILSPNDRLDLSISWEKAEFEKMVFDFINEELEDLVYTGKRLTFTPEWTVNLAYEHNFDLPNGGNLAARIDSRYQSDMLINFMETASRNTPTGPVEVDLAGYNEQEAYTQTNCSLTYAHPDGKWSLSAYVKNLEDYAVKKNLMFAQLMIGPPRTYGAVISVRF